MPFVRQGAISQSSVSIQNWSPEKENDKDDGFDNQGLSPLAVTRRAGMLWSLWQIPQHRARPPETLAAYK